ncbi:parathyroid hormone/parathyroid hormone-related peptide receptor-like isoform X2 [Petromyzon marinus]|uniref:parathyroid hormone/parathyroid hormone-related peptide receptor-like isoform X2 n=1 Tax=Petromyzon marinus TaxID=7757 RepID=UPI003F71D9C9
MNATEVGAAAAASMQMDADDVLTKEGQMLLLLVPRQQCESIIHSFNHTPGSLCPPEWDAIFCWPPTLPGQWVNVSCPHYIYDFNHKGQAYRRCDDGGQWLVAPNQNKTWTNYNECMQMTSHDDNLEEIHRLYTLSTIGYSVSMASLFVALSILAYLKKLHCTRNYIHMHLFVSFILRGASFFVCNIMIEAVMPKAGAIVGSWAEGGDADAVLLEELRTFTAVPTLDKSPYLGCKLSVIFFLYFLATNYYWVFAEGLYLHSLVFMSFFSNRTKHLWTYIFIGWGFPTLFVGAWAVVRAVLADTRCWNINAGNIKWIYQAPMIIANTVNFAFFVNIVRVLATKLRETNAGRYDARRQYTAYSWPSSTASAMGRFRMKSARRGLSGIWLRTWTGGAAGARACWARAEATGPGRRVGAGPRGPPQRALAARRSNPRPTCAARRGAPRRTLGRWRWPPPLPSPSFPRTHSTIAATSGDPNTRTSR